MCGCCGAARRAAAARRGVVDLQAAGMAPKRARRVAAECRAQAAEAHAMFRVGLQYEGAVPVESAALRQGEWLGLLAALEACRVPLALPPPALDHCMERLAAIEGGEAPPGDAERLVVALEAAARFATEPYSNEPEQISNNFVHLTNFSINKESEKFVQNINPEEAEVNRHISASFST